MIWTIEDGKGEEWRKRKQITRKKETTIADIYTNICGVVVIELFRTILIYTIKENGTTFQKVLF